MNLWSFFSLFLMTLFLSGCIGTTLTQRSTDLSQSYPSLHSVPERPPKINFKKTDEELKEFEQNYKKKIKMNEELRNSTPPVTKPKEEL